METGTAGTRFLLTPTVARLFTWGSSSMSGEGGDHGAPSPSRPHEHLRAVLSPGEVIPTAQGGTQSFHNRVQIGLDAPTVAFPGGRAATPGTAPVSGVDHHMNSWRGFSCAGSINGVPGVLAGADTHFTWTPADGSTLTEDGPFVSAFTSDLKGAHHLFWCGKNNIGEQGGALTISDTDAMVDFTGASERCFILGQWVTPLDSTRIARAVARVNDHQRARYGDRFLDVQELLSTSWGLQSPPVRALAFTAMRGRIPESVVAPDGIHLNARGNQVVVWALLERMKQLGWI